MISNKFTQTLIFILTLGLTMYLLTSCSGAKSKESGSSKDIKQTAQKYEGVTIEVDISNDDWLSILLAKDGTINRKGSRSFDPKDKNFFMGLTSSEAFDSLMNEMPEELLQYCNAHSPACDTLKQTCKAKISFGNNTSSCDIEYCVNGTINNLPKAIKDFIYKSIQVTEPWYQKQQKSLQSK